MLDLAPELGAGIPSDEWEAARQACRGELVRVAPGRLEPAPGALDGDPWMALVIVSGVMCREVRLCDRHLLELLGAGDALQLPVDVEDRLLGTDVTLTAVAQSELLVLGVPFLRAAARWPSLMMQLHRRLEAQRAELAVQALIAHLPKAEHRLLLMLWHLADRFGIVTPDGIVVQLPLSHDLLGRLTAARRSTASLALGQLEGRGELKRLPDGFWLLTGGAQRAIEVIAATHQTQTFQDAHALRAQARLTRAQHPPHHTPAPDSHAP